MLNIKMGGKRNAKQPSSGHFYRFFYYTANTKETMKIK